MDGLVDWLGRPVRFPQSRLAHVEGQAGRPGVARLVKDALAAPDFVVVSRSDEAVRLSYRMYPGGAVGDKWVCVVVKYAADGAFVVTAYYTDRIKAGEYVWPEL